MVPIQIKINLFIKRPKGQQYNRDTMILIDTQKVSRERRPTGMDRLNEITLTLSYNRPFRFLINYCPLGHNVTTTTKIITNTLCIDPTVHSLVVVSHVKSTSLPSQLL
jgi:hypothetical protein